MVLDLCNGLGHADGSVLVHLARTGERAQQEHRATTNEPESGLHIPRMPHERNISVKAPLIQASKPQPANPVGNYDLLPELARLVPRAKSGEPFGDEVPGAPRKGRYWGFIALFAAACLGPLVVVGILVGSDGLWKLLGFSPIVAHGRAQVTKPAESSEWKKAENPDPPKSAGPIGERRIAEIPAPIIEPNKKPTLDSDNSKATPKRQDIVVQKKTPKETRVVFFQLPPIQESMYGESKTDRTAEISLRDGADIMAQRFSISSYYYLAQFDLEERDPGIEFLVKTRVSAGTVLERSIQLARFTIKNDRLQFTWTEGAFQRRELAERLRDGIICIDIQDGDQRFALLRNLQITPGIALITSDHPRLVKDDLKKRTLELPWTKSDSLKGTKWPLWIRRWKVVSRLRPGEPGLEIASGEESHHHHKIEKDIITDEVLLRLEIDPKNILVSIDFNQQEVIARRRNRKERLEIIQAGLAHISKELSYISASERTTTSEEKRSKLIKDKAKLDSELGELKHINKINDHLSMACEAELSLIVSLKLDDSHRIDIAKFGEFAEARP